MSEDSVSGERGAPLTGAAEVDPYVAKWLAAAPARELVLLFCPTSGRRLAALWGAVCNELDEAVFDLTDAAVAQAKLAWWGEELTHAAQGEAQHPLTRAFHAGGAASRIASLRWAELVHAGLRLVADDAASGDTAALLARHRPYAAAIAGIEADLFGGDAAVEAILASHLLRLWPRHGHASGMRWPLHLRARHQASADGSASPALQRDFASELLAAWTTPARGPVWRRSLAAVDRWQLQRLAQAGTTASLGRWRALWLCWRAARGA